MRGGVLARPGLCSAGLTALRNRLWRDQRGAALIEYALLIGLVTLTVLPLIIAVGSWASSMWDNFASITAAP